MGDKLGCSTHHWHMPNSVSNVEQLDDVNIRIKLTLSSNLESQGQRFWLKFSALLNIATKSRPLDTSHADMSLLKLFADANICRKLNTRETFQRDKSLLNFSVRENILSRAEALETSQFDNVRFPYNM